MHRTMRFKRFFRAKVIDGDGVYLLSEGGRQIRLHGILIEKMAPLLDGGKTRTEISDALAAEFSATRVHAALKQVEDAGLVVESDTNIDQRAGGFWELHDLDGDSTVRKLSEQAISIVSFSEVSTDNLTAAVASTGLTVDPAATGLAVVIVDDYLDPELERFNQEALAAGRPWLLAKPTGGTIWVGPIFEPEQTACWECLATRLRTNQTVTRYVRQRDGAAEALVTSVADLPATRAIGAHLTALYAAGWIAGARRLPVVDTDPTSWCRRVEVVTFDAVTLAARRHILTRRPQCVACGDPGLQARRQRQPVHVRPRPKLEVVDGGHRAASPEDLLAVHEPLISPLTGAVKQLIKTPRTVEGLHTYGAGQNFAIPMAHIGDLRKGLRSIASGKGMSDLQARASAVGEAIERHSGLYRGDEARRRASYAELGPDLAITPNEMHQYSDAQFATRAEWNASCAQFHLVCDPFDPTQPIDWTPVWSLTGQRTRYAPTASLFFGYPIPDPPHYASSDSNGNAAGTSLEDAIVQGFMELVERDSVAIWWYNMLRRPEIDLASFQDPYFDAWQRRYRGVQRETWALDLTTDLGIPSVVTVSRRIDKPAEDILIAFGAHFDIRIAISRAMTEMNQFLPAVRDATAENDEYSYSDPDQQRWWRTATTTNQPYLRPADGSPRTATDYDTPTTDDLAEDIRRAQRIVENAGMEMLVLDQTRPDIDLPVVKVIVPGMRHFWNRFAPGRLYDVPVRLGWLPRPTAEADLNPIPMFL